MFKQNIAKLLLLGTIFTISENGKSSIYSQYQNINQDSSTHTRKNSSNIEQLANGETLYVAQCSMCHGDNGTGEPAGSSIISSLSFASTQSVIEMSMPLGNAGSCDNDCARNIII